jgi:hypothetical protein
VGALSAKAGTCRKSGSSAMLDASKPGGRTILLCLKMGLGGSAGEPSPRNATNVANTRSWPLMNSHRRIVVAVQLGVTVRVDPTDNTAAFRRASGRRIADRAVDPHPR